MAIVEITPYKRQVKWQPNNYIRFPDELKDHQKAISRIKDNI
jgi:hypothetical protein